ncbi:MAG: DUF429 domain-containing protein [Gemmatimonadales bacterium]
MMNERRRFVAGVDGCKGGWVVVLLELNGDREVVDESCRIVDSFWNVIGLPETPRFVAVDIPIGLPTVAMPGGRACDREARQMLGKRGTSVFSPPVRAVLSADCYEKAVALSRASSRHAIGINRQVYGLVPKLREVHDAMTPDLQLRIREVHPELSFAIMNGGPPLLSSKRSDKGRVERLALLDRHFSGVKKALAAVRKSAAPDVIDAYAAAWSAWRMARGKARYVPEELQMDSRGLRMGIWF